MPKRNPTRDLRVALVSDVFYQGDAATRLRACLHECKRRGASLAILPELALHPWAPATKELRDADSEAPGGDRESLQRQIAREVGIGLLGSVLTQDPVSNRRFNTVLFIAREGELIARYRKSHIPEEPGFWESSHYEAGDDLPPVVDNYGMPVGVQICSDANRPVGSHVLGALGAQAIFVPRASVQNTYERWKLVLRSNALTAAAYVLSVNRPFPEMDVPLGGPSIVVAPDGSLITESTDQITMVTLHTDDVERARRDYPGYLPIRASLYARWWNTVSEVRRQRGLGSW